MNKKEALEKCLALWTWLAEHPTETKATAYSALNLTEDHCFCPACEYAFHQDNFFERSCEDHCPISLFRWLSGGGREGCLHPNSPYRTYSSERLDSEARASVARQIVEAVQSDLDALDALDTTTPSST